MEVGVLLHKNRTDHNRTILKSVRTMLDGLTEADTEAGRVNDDQLQAMWGMTLEEAQSMEHRKVVAVCKGAPSHADAQHIGGLLHRAVYLTGCKEISQPDHGALPLAGIGAR